MVIYEHTLELQEAMDNISIPITTAIGSSVAGIVPEPNSLIIIGGTIIAFIIGITSFVAFLKNLWGFKSWILRNTTIRGFYWYITNRKISLRINIQKKYPMFEPDIQELLDHVQTTITGKYGKFLSPPEVSGNTFQFVAERMSAPIQFLFFPDVEDTDGSNSNFSQEEYTIVQCKIQGNLTFVYREFESYQTMLILIDEIYRKIESDYQRGEPVFSNILIDVSLSNDFTENWSKKEIINIEGARIMIGSNIVEINSKTISPLLHLNKYILKLPTSNEISA